MHSSIEVCPLENPCPNPGEMCHQVPFNTNPLELAENICVGAIQHKIIATDAPGSVPDISRAAWAQLELGLNLADTEQAAFAFTQADDYFNKLLAQTDPTKTERLFKATLARRYIPVFAASSRKGETDTETRSLAYGAARQTLAELLLDLDYLRDMASGSSPLIGVFGEVAVLTLALRAGHMLYPTSDREGKTQQTSKNHDLYDVKNGRKDVPVEIKFSRNTREYDKQILVLIYTDICKEMAGKWPPHERPKLNVLAFDLARILTQEPRRQLSGYEREFLQLAISYITEKIENHVP